MNIGKIITWLIIGLMIMGIVFVVGGAINGAIEEQNKKYEVKEEIITIQSISPKPGLSPNSFGQLMVNNAEQLMFYTTDGRGFQNTENERAGKFETRDLLINLKLGGTYKIKYYGYRDGRNSEYPNILAIVQIKNETNAIGFSWNDFLGDWNLKDMDRFDFSKYELIDGKMVFTGESSNINQTQYTEQITTNKKISNEIENN